MNQIDRWLLAIEKSFGPARAQFDTKRLRELHADGETTKMVGVVKRAMIPSKMKLRIGYVNKGGDPKVPAWINSPSILPTLGSKDFENQQFEMHIQRKFIDRVGFETLVSCVAHELSHVVLNSVNHSLRENEKCVDLIAMYFGFAEIIHSGKVYTKRPPTKLFSRTRANFSFGTFHLGTITKDLNEIIQSLKEGTEYRILGYLNQEEVAYALQRIQQLRT